MWKNVKSVLYNEFKTTNENTERNNTLHVADGGFCSIKWNGPSNNAKHLVMYAKCL